ncbi:hypothetical protein PO909_007169 [Leuciscus waleckii]
MGSFVFALLHMLRSLRLETVTCFPCNTRVGCTAQGLILSLLEPVKKFPRGTLCEREEARLLHSVLRGPDYVFKRHLFEECIRYKHIAEQGRVVLWLRLRVGNRETVGEGCWKRGIMEECRTKQEQCLAHATPHKPLGATEEELGLCHPENWPDGLETHY